MKRTVWIAALAAGVICLAASGPAGDVSSFLFTAYKAGQAVDLPSQAIIDLDEAKAYQVQWDYVGKLVDSGEAVAGFKAGLTSFPAQKKFKAPGPVCGVLLKSMAFSGVSVSVNGYSRMMLEVEVGYILGTDITEKVDSVGVRKAVAKIASVIEVPDLALKSLKGITWQDVAAINVGARGYLVGGAAAPDRVDPNRVTGQLFMNGKALSPPIFGRAAMGDQWRALAWTINSALKQGYAVRKGMLVITGSLGKMHPGKPGAYKAVYTGGLETLEFTIK